MEQLLTNILVGLDYGMKKLSITTFQDLKILVAVESQTFQVLKYVTGGPSKLQNQETPRKPPWGFPKRVD